MGSLVGTACVDSIAVADRELAARLSSPAFFDTERHPDVRFESSTIHRLGRHIELDGRLTIKACTLAVAAVGTLDDAPGSRRGPARIRLELETRIDRRQFALDWHARYRDDGRAAGTEVHLRVDLALRQA